MVFGKGKREASAANPAKPGTPAAPVNPLVTQFMQATALMQNGRYAAALPVLEALAKKPDALVAAKVSRTAVAFFIAVNHIELKDAQADPSVGVVQKLALDPVKAPGLRVHAYQILSGLYIDQAFNSRGSKKPEVQAKAQPSLEKGKAYAEAAMALAPGNARAKLASAYVAVYEGRVDDARVLMAGLPKSNAGHAKKIYEAIMEELNCDLLMRDEDGVSSDPNGDSSVMGMQVAEPDPKGPKGNGGTQIFGKGLLDDDDEPGGPGAAGARVPRPVKPGSSGEGADAPIELEPIGGQESGKTFDLA